MDFKLALFTGIDIPIPELEMVIHQPTIKEISFIGDICFFTGVQCLNISKSSIFQDETLLTNLNNFQIFMMIMTEKEAADKKECVLSLFSLLFPNYKVVLTPRALSLIKDEEIHTVDETNFEILQDIIRQLFCFNQGPMDAQSFNPQDKKAKEIADQLLRARERVGAKKSEGGSIFAQYASVLTVGLGSMSLQDSLNLTMYQLLDLIERYMLFVNWDLDIKSRLAGAKSDSRPENWMKNIH